MPDRRAPLTKDERDELRKNCDACLEKDELKTTKEQRAASDIFLRLLDQVETLEERLSFYEVSIVAPIVVGGTIVLPE